MWWWLRPLPHSSARSSFLSPPSGHPICPGFSLPASTLSNMSPSSGQLTSLLACESYFTNGFSLPSLLGTLGTGISPLDRHADVAPPSPWSMCGPPAHHMTFAPFSLYYMITSNLSTLTRPPQLSPGCGPPQSGFPYSLSDPLITCPRTVPPSDAPLAGPGVAGNGPLAPSSGSSGSIA